MKIGIITIYNSQNCGSFLQALAMYTYVNKLGYDVEIIKNKMNYQNKFWYRFLMAFKYFFKGHRGKGKRILQTYKGFNKARKRFFRIGSITGKDVCIYGSDTIWNLDSEYFKKEWKHYWGVNFCGKKIAYAPSIGSTKIDNILKNQELCKAIKNFYKVSVRDKNTYKIVSDILGAETGIEYVIDPTMLMKREFYESIASECNEKDFIFFYYFGRIEKEYMDEIKKYAQKEGKKLICFGDNISGVDKQLPFNPLDMMAYYLKADLVITNTFHGNVFSIIFNKPFINIDAGKAKVNDLLEDFGLSERTINESTAFFSIASKKIDYGKVNFILEEKRNQSGNYIKTALKECERRMSDAR